MMPEERAWNALKPFLITTPNSMDWHINPYASVYALRTAICRAICDAILEATNQSEEEEEER